MSKNIGYVLGVAMLIFGGLYIFESLNKNQTPLEAHGLADKNIHELVDILENNEFDPSVITSSIYREKVQVNIENELFEFNISTNEMYVSIAPYINTTHDCYIHSLTGCQGELIQQTIQIIIYDENGEMMRNQIYQTGQDGFIGIWLPLNKEYRIEIYYQDLQTSMLISTSNTTKTCYTEGKLS